MRDIFNIYEQLQELEIDLQDKVDEYPFASNELIQACGLIKGARTWIDKGMKKAPAGAIIVRGPDENEMVER